MKQGFVLILFLVTNIVCLDKKANSNKFLKDSKTNSAVKTNTTNTPPPKLIYHSEGDKIVVESSLLNNEEQTLIKRLLDTMNYYHDALKGKLPSRIERVERISKDGESEKLIPVHIKKRDDDVYYVKKDGNDIYYNGKKSSSHYMYAGKEENSVYYSGLANNKISPQTKTNSGYETPHYYKSAHISGSSQNAVRNRPNTSANITPGFKRAIIDNSFRPTLNRDSASYRNSYVSRRISTPKTPSYAQSSEYPEPRQTPTYPQYRPTSYYPQNPSFYNFHQISPGYRGQQFLEPELNRSENQNYLKDYKRKLARSLVDYYYNTN